MRSIHRCLILIADKLLTEISPHDVIYIVTVLFLILWRSVRSSIHNALPFWWFLVSLRPSGYSSTRERSTLFPQWSQRPCPTRWERFVASSGPNSRPLVQSSKRLGDKVTGQPIESTILSVQEYQHWSLRRYFSSTLPNYRYEQ